MTSCKIIQSQIDSFEKNKLSLKNEEIFTNHIISCPDCREEMEIYYIISYGLDDENEDILKDELFGKFYKSFDFTGLVDEKINNSIKMCHARRKWSAFNRLRYFGVMTAMLLTLLIKTIIVFF